MWTAVTLKFDFLQHPKLIRTKYRMPSKRWGGFHLWEAHGKFTMPELSIKVELQHARKQVWMRLEGRISRAGAERLGDRLRDSLARSKSQLILDLKKLHWDKAEDLRPLREKLEAYRSRVRLIMPKLAVAHPELLLLAAMFQHYKG